MAGARLINRYDIAAISSPSAASSGLPFAQHIEHHVSPSARRQSQLRVQPAQSFPACTFCLGGDLGGSLGGQSSLPGELAFVFLSGSFVLDRTRCSRRYDGFTLCSLLKSLRIIGIQGSLKLCERRTL